MSDRVTITIDTLRGGSQERDYGPHVHEADITISLPEGQVQGSAYYIDRPYAERVAKALVSTWCEAERHEGADDYFSPHLVRFDQTAAEGRSVTWRVRVETPFTD